MRMVNDPGTGYDGSGIIPQRPPAVPPTAVPPVVPPAGPQPSIPSGNVPPTTPVPAPNLGPTDQNPLAPLNNYQNQTLQSSYQAPAFQGSNTFQPSQITAPLIPPMNYQAGSGSAPQINTPNYQAGNYQAP